MGPRQRQRSGAFAVLGIGAPATGYIAGRSSHPPGLLPPFATLLACPPARRDEPPRDRALLGIDDVSNITFGVVEDGSYL